MTLPNIPPPAKFTPQVIPLADLPDTTVADIENARAAWQAAHEAVMLAWKVTPSYLLNTRAPITRGAPNQAIASSAIIALMTACSGKLDNIKRNDYARGAGYDWAVATDAEVARERD